jgi:hypothetical protein
VTLVMNIWAAPIINHEKLYKVDYVVTALIVAGVTVTTMSAPRESATITPEYVVSHFFTTQFLMHELLMWSISAAVFKMARMVYADGGRAANPRLSSVSIVLYPWLCGVFVAHQTLLIKILIELLKSGELIHPVNVAYFCLWATSGLVQLRAMNEGLRVEGAVTFVSLFNSFCCTNMIIISAAFNDSFSTAVSGITSNQLARFCIGVLLVITGVLLILLRPEPPGGEDVEQLSEQGAVMDSGDGVDAYGNPTATDLPNNPLKVSGLNVDVDAASIPIGSSNVVGSSISP